MSGNGELMKNVFIAKCLKVCFTLKWQTESLCIMQNHLSVCLWFSLWVYIVYICLHFRLHTSILCHWSKYQLLTTPIFPQNSDKTREWAGVRLLKPLSLLFYYYSPRRPQLRPAISLKPVRVSASRMNRLMGGRRCMCECLCAYASVYICLQTKGCVYVACFWIYCVFYRLGRLLNGCSGT